MELKNGTAATSKSDRRVIPIALASLPIVLFIVLPLTALVIRAWSPGIFTRLVEPDVARAISLSITTTLLTTVLTVLFGTPAALLLSRRRFPGRKLLDTLFDLPVVLPPAVAGLALLMTFGRRGILGPLLTDMNTEIAFTQTAVVLAQLFVSSPLYIRAATAGFAAVDRELEQAAALDGASPTNVFWKVTVPLALPSLTGGAVMTWARALGEFGATILFAGNFPGRTQTMPLAIYMGFEVDFSSALTLALLLLLISFTVLLVVKGLLHQRYFSP